MEKYYKTDEWCIVEEGFDASMQEASESIFSLGNGRFGLRANFEEKYSGDSLQGTYIAGVYYPDKTRVGWWKNGYPEYFAKILNAPSFISVYIKVDNEELDLKYCEVKNFHRELNMQKGILLRSFIAVLPSGKELEIQAKRFLCMKYDSIAVIEYTVKALNFNGSVEIFSFIDGDVANRDSNYDEKFWNLVETGADKEKAWLQSRTKKTEFDVSMAMKCDIYIDKNKSDIVPELVKEDTLAGHRFMLSVQKGQEIKVHKFVAVRNYMISSADSIIKDAVNELENAHKLGYDHLLKSQEDYWAVKWEEGDIVIEGDPESQQAIRFNIFHLNQTYTGTDERLNIGPKGFTGEKYGGTTYWDTEAFLLSFYLSTAPQSVSRNLLVYRYKHLEKAIENAQKLGFNTGAALYPMVTINGEECHNEWEITFEEIHRNGAIAFAIYNYIRYTGDKKYLAEYGLHVLIGISRFWRQRVHWSDIKGQYVMLGVTGPNEYENNVNNNWYTNKMAQWTLKYTVESLQYVMEEYPVEFDRIVKETNLDYEKETTAWKEIVVDMYFPYYAEKEVFLQQDGYMDKEQKLVCDLDPKERPINQHWSWDRILRSVYIKQADVLQGIFCFEDEYDTKTIRRNYNFYEPRTVHESSLSPCVHSILANRIDQTEDALKLYLRTSRLDLDDYNREVAEGLHITSMGGTWLSIVYGFGGLRVKDDNLHFNPHLPEDWKTIKFKIGFRGSSLDVLITHDKCDITLLHGEPMDLYINGELTSIS